MDRTRALEAFERYVSAYEPGNPRIALKIDHTLRVAGLCERIAATCGVGDDDVDLAWLLGLLHDIGRFEQVRRYDSFSDADTVDHAMLGARVLFDHGEGEEPLIRRFVAEDHDDALIRLAVSTHSAYRLPAGLAKREQALCDILRDADKVDILKVNCVCPVADIYGVTEQELFESELSPACVEGFYEHRCLPKGIRRFPADVLLSHVCFAWEIVYDESLRAVREQGHLRGMLGRSWSRPETQAAFDAMADHMVRELGV